ncbi:hypothetical protein ILUMI_08462 [Ignelater luminosus]|uniref:Deoxyuridine 5'-triphosphate nucleotidohydrolase n=1 Tax=Ignelater luminosus TaxID=2038154 RepID=A0A8K0DB91_IGNLU|nr:hypothetical protein ILUMI_08462 [Ignelater luminosus]
MTACLPTRGSSCAVGLNLYGAGCHSISLISRLAVGTGLIFKLSACCYGRIAPRSGLAPFDGIDVGAGIMDEDHRGCISVLIINHSETTFNVSVGDRIVQLICERILYPTVEEASTMSSNV